MFSQLSEVDFSIGIGELGHLLLRQLWKTQLISVENAVAISSKPKDLILKINGIETL